MEIDQRLLFYKPISIILDFDWDTSSYDERVQLRHNYVQEQKKKNPNYVGWDFPEHFSSFFGGGKNKHAETVVDFSRLVSTTGRLISTGRKNLITTIGYSNGKGYLGFDIKTKSKIKRLKAHRVVACTFIPIPDHLNEFKEKLVVNHKNDNGCCNWQSNLEWVTQQENVTKAIETGAKDSTYFKCTVKLPGKLFGKQYYFYQNPGLKAYGFVNSEVYKSINTGKLYVHCLWEIETKQNAENKTLGIPLDELAIIRDPKNGRSNAKGAVGTIMSEGPCKGERFVIYGKKQLKMFGFHEGMVSECVKGKIKYHRGCVWEYVSRKEGSKFQQGLTKSQKEHIFPQEKRNI
ncbi:putative HNH endonuclease [Aeromonas phage CF8]|nr:putative HNH endonuclease [Aeromonas phage CF8]